MAGITVGGAGGGEHDPVTAAAGGGITVVAPQILSVNNTVARNTWAINAGNGLEGGGNLASGGIELRAKLGAGLTFVGGAIAVDSTAVGVPTTRRVIAGAGLLDAGNDTLAANITLNVVASSTGGLEVGADEIHIKFLTPYSGLTADASGLRILDSVAGDGLDILNKIMFVGQGNGITVGSNAVAVLALSTGGLTVGSTGVRVLLRSAGSGLRTDVDGLWIYRRGDSGTESGIGMNAADGIWLADSVAGNGLLWDAPLATTRRLSVVAHPTGGLQSNTADVQIKLRVAGSGLQTDSDGLWLFRRGNLGTESGISMSSTAGIYLADTVAGDGLMWTTTTERFMQVRTGNGLELAGTSPNMSVRVNQAFNFNWTGDHMFDTGVVTFNTDPQVSANLDFIGAHSITSTGTNSLTIAPGGDLVLNPGQDDVLPGGNMLIDLGDYNRKWRTLFAAELYVETLVAQEVMATIGGRIMVTPTTTLVSNVTPAGSQITVKHNAFVSGEYLLLQAANPTATGGFVAHFEIMKTTSGATPIAITGADTVYRYNVTRNVDGGYVWPGAGETGDAWNAGDAVVSLGRVEGDGWIELTSTKTVRNHFGPTIAIYTRTDDAAWDDVKPTVAMGNLTSFVDYPGDEFGFAVGNDLTLWPNDPVTPFKGLTADRNKGVRLFNTELEMYEAGEKIIELDLTYGLRFSADVNPVGYKRAITFHTDLDPVSAAFGRFGGYMDGLEKEVHLRVELHNAGETGSLSLGATQDGALPTQSALIWLYPAYAGLSGSYLYMRADNAKIYTPKLLVGEGTRISSTVTGADSTLHIYENTSAVDATAGLTIEQDGTTGDAALQFLLTGGRRWMAGIDNSVANDPFVISSSGNLSTTPELVLTTAGALTITGALAIGGALSGVTTLSVGTSTATTALVSNVLRARTAAGLSLMDDGSTLGIFIEDGGAVGIASSTPPAGVQLHVAGTGVLRATAEVRTPLVTTSTGAVGLALLDSGRTVVVSSSSYVEPHTGFTAQNNNMVVVRQATATSANTPYAGFVFSNNQSGTSHNIAQLLFMNEGIGAAEKRVAQILVQTDGATNSGKYTFRVYNAGTLNDALTIKASGRVGIGESTPGAMLHITDTVGSADHLYINSLGNAPTIYTRRSPSAAVGLITGDVYMNLAGGGRYSSSAMSGVMSYMRFVANQTWNSTSQGSYITFGTTPNGSDTAVGVFTIEHNGVLRAPGVKDNPVATVPNMTIDASTSLITRTTHANSSLRYKDDIVTIAPDTYSHLFDSLRPVSYRLKPDYGGNTPSGAKRKVGLIAEDVEAAGGELFIQYDQQGRPDVLMYDRLIVVLIAELQRLKKEMAQVKERLN